MLEQKYSMPVCSGFRPAGCPVQSGLRSSSCDLEACQVEGTRSIGSACGEDCVML